EQDHQGEPADDGGLAVAGAPVPGPGSDAPRLVRHVSVPLQRGSWSLGAESTFPGPDSAGVAGVWWSQIAHPPGWGRPHHAHALSCTAMDSHSIFVVQRTFAQVRRGYDPDAVDRHLELVAEMFNRGLAGEKRREAERSAAEARHELEAARLEAEATVEG